MNARFLYIISILLLVLISACKNSSTQPAPPSPQYFPNKVGNTWTYSYYDSLGNKSDTVIVTIVGEKIISTDQSAAIWQFKYSDKVDTFYVTLSADTLRFIQHLSSPWYNNKFIFPLYAGGKWRGDFMNDTNYVAENSSIKVIAGNFSNGYKIVEGWGGLNDYGFINTWFVPYVGIVSKYHKGWSFGMANEKYELISYNIK